MPYARQFFGAILFALAFLLVPATAQISWPTIGESCMPMGAKMKPVMNWATNTPVSPMPACHCPPTSFCPKTQAEWDDATRQPGGITDTCCKRPYDCTVEFVYASDGTCPTKISTGPEQANFCMKYGAVPVPKDPLPANEANNVKLRKLRDDAATAINSCLASTCKPLLDNVLRNAPKNASQTTSSNAADFSRFVDCELSCRADAAKTLSIDPNTITRLFQAALKPATGQVAAHGERAPITTSVRHMNVLRVLGSGKTLYGGWYEGWFETTATRQGWLKSYLTQSPAPVCIAGQGLESALNCVDKAESTICYSGWMHDTYCGDCLAPGTHVSMADGTMRQIELIGAGDRVKGLNGEKIVEELVVQDWQKVSFYRINGSLLLATKDHPILTTAGWRSVEVSEEREKYGLRDVGKLAVGDVMITDRGEVAVVSIAEMPTDPGQRTYNLKMKGGGAFYANGVVVKDNVNVD